MASASLVLALVLLTELLEEFDEAVRDRLVRDSVIVGAKACADRRLDRLVQLPGPIGRMLRRNAHFRRRVLLAFGHYGLAHDQSRTAGNAWPSGGRRLTNQRKR